MERQEWQKEPAEPEDIKITPKETKMESKTTNIELQGAKKESKGDQSASQNRFGRQDRFGEPKRVAAQDILRAILVYFSIFYLFIL